MAATILIKFCGLMVHSKPNNVILESFPGKSLKLNNFLVSGIFAGKADTVMLLCFECTIMPQHLIKIVRAIFEKFEIFIFI